MLSWGAASVEFSHSKLWACGLETISRQNRDTKEIQRHRIEAGGQSNEY